MVHKLLCSWIYIAHQVLFSTHERIKEYCILLTLKMAKRDQMDEMQMCRKSKPVCVVNLCFGLCLFDFFLTKRTFIFI